MEYVTMDSLLAQSRWLPTNEKKLLLEAYADTAETMVQNYTRRTTSELRGMSENGESIPGPIVLAVLLIVGHYCENPSATSRQPVNFTALGLDHLLKPYRKFDKNWRR